MNTYEKDAVRELLERKDFVSSTLIKDRLEVGLIRANEIVDELYCVGIVGKPQAIFDVQIRPGEYGMKLCLEQSIAREVHKEFLWVLDLL